MSSDTPTPQPTSDEIVEDVVPLEGLAVVLGDKVITPNAAGSWDITDSILTADDLLSAVSTDPGNVSTTPVPAAPPPATPAPIDEADVTGPPPGGLLDLPHHERAARRDRLYIAWALLALLFILVITGCIGWLQGSDSADFQAFAVMFSPVVTLIGTVLAFYFSRKD